MKVRDKVVGMLRLNAVTGERGLREIRQVVGDDHARLAADGRCEYVPVIGVGQVEMIDETFMTGDQTVRYRKVHQLARPLNLLRSQVRPILQHRARPFLVYALGPARPEQIGQRQAQQQIAQRCRIENTGIVNRNETRHPSVSHPEFLSLTGQIIQRLLAAHLRAAPVLKGYP